MARLKCVGGCAPLFFGGVTLDCLGLILLFVGIFGDLRLGGRFYGDFLIYSGSLVVFISLAFWVMWYVGNVRVEEEEEEGDGWRKKKPTSSVVQLARKLSERLSLKLNGEVRAPRPAEEDEEGQRGAGQVSSPAHKASRVTWGRSTAYHNEGYEDMDSEKNVETEVERNPET